MPIPKAPHTTRYASSNQRPSQKRHLKRRKSRPPDQNEKRKIFENGRVRSCLTSPLFPILLVALLSHSHLLRIARAPRRPARRTAHKIVARVTVGLGLLVVRAARGRGGFEEIWVRVFAWLQRFFGSRERIRGMRVRSWRLVIVGLILVLFFLVFFVLGFFVLRVFVPADFFVQRGGCGGWGVELCQRFLTR